MGSLEHLIGNDCDLTRNSSLVFNVLGDIVLKWSWAKHLEETRTVRGAELLVWDTDGHKLNSFRQQCTVGRTSVNLSKAHTPPSINKKLIEMIIAFHCMFDTCHTHGEHLTLFQNGAQREFCCGKWDWAAEYCHVIKEEKAKFRRRWLYTQAANCYSWLFMRDHKSKEIRTAKVSEKWMYVIILSCGLDLLDRPSLQSNRKSRKRCRRWRANFTGVGKF